MRIRYTMLSVLAVLLGGAVTGYAAQGTQLPKNGTAGSSTTRSTSASTAQSKVTPKKRSTTSVHATKTSTSAKRRVAHTTLVHAQIAPTPSRISEIQAALSKEGAYQGEPNGKWDAASVDAMRQFQNDHGLTPSGKIDALTLQKLGLGSQVSGMGAPLPLALPQASAADGGAQTERP
jgi:peptidoglycan hydrolase-like protein with peptidoglycan-binding domain